MSVIATVVRCLIAVSVLVLFAACGGGGGGVNNSSTYTLSTDTVSVEAYAGGYAPPEQHVSVQVSGTSTVYLGVTYGGVAVAGASLVITDPIAGTARVDIQLAPTSGTGMVPGNNTGTVSVIGCYDANCSSPLPGSPKIITVNYTLKQFVITSALNFNATEGAVPASQQLSFGVDGPAGQNWNSGIQYLDGSNWLSLNRATGSLPDTINVSVPALPPGTYQAMLSIATPGPIAITRTLMVTYVVSPALVVPEMLEFNLSTTSTLADLSRTVTAQSNTGGDLGWTASTNVPWLSITPGTGNTTGSNQFTVSLNSAVGIPLSRPTTQNTITVTPTNPAYAARTITVWLHGDLPVVYSVNPAAIAVNSTDEPVILRGYRLDASSLSGRQLMAGDSVVSSFLSKGYSEIEASLPALSAGRHLVYVTNHLGLKLAWSELDVSTASYAAAAISSSGRKAKLIYSPHEKSVFALDTTNSALRKFSYDTNTSSWSVQSYNFTGLGGNLLRDMALTPTASDIVVLDNQNLHEISVGTLTRNRVVARPSGVYSAYRFHQIGFLNRGEAYITTANGLDEGTFAYYYSDQSKVISSLLTGTAYYKGVLSASGNGRRLLVGEDGDPAWANMSYYTTQDPSDSLTFTSLYLQLLTASVDRAGTYSILQRVGTPPLHEVYNAAFNLVGTLPTTTSAAVIRADGLLAYTYETGTQSVRAFDLASPNGSDGFTEIGTASVLASSPGINPVMTISHDGQTLFVGGDSALVVVPAP